MILAHEQDDTERYFFFSFKVQMVQAKINSYFNLLVYSLICIQKYTRYVLTLVLENDDEQRFN